jgi:hypothetical protein
MTIPLSVFFERRAIEDVFSSLQYLFEKFQQVKSWGTSFVGFVIIQGQS